MGLPVEVNNLMMGAVGGYQISRSLRFRSSASAYLSRTPASASNRQTWTWSGWVKRGSLSGSKALFNSFLTNNLTETSLRFNSDTLNFYSYVSGYLINASTSAVFRDPSAWYHIILSVDTTQATNSNGVKIWVNGVQQTLTFSAYTQNHNTYVNNTTQHYIATNYDGNYFDGYLAEVNFIDGQALTPSSFGETDSITGVWNPKKYSGTYGTNGFYLPFSNTTSTTTLVQDSSGNGNNWTPNNISLTAGTTYDSMIDSPTPYADGNKGRGNYAVLNPINNGLDATISDGNLTIAYGSSSTVTGTPATIGVNSGKWYWEVIPTGGTGANATIGVVNTTTNSSTTSGIGFYVGYTSSGWSYAGFDGNKRNGSGGVAYGATFTTNDVIGIAFDADVGTLTFYKNNVSQGTAFTGLTSGPYFPAVGDASELSTVSMVCNFGQRPFSYTPPSGYKALNTYNLPAPSIANGAQYMAATTYTGNGTSQSISNAVNGVSFQPDFIWIKDRSTASAHALTNSVVGITKYLASNDTLAETTDTTSVTTINSNGFNLGAGSVTYYTNRNGDSFAAWQWKAGGTAVTNNSGTISSQVSANTSAGFSIATYTGTGANATIGHGLGVAPSMVIVRSRNLTGEGWNTYHTSLAAGNVVQLNATIASTSAPTMFTTTLPTSSVFSVGTNTGTNGSGSTYVAYCFSAVSGYSAFGSYTGNGSSDGPFVFTNMRARFILIKNTAVSNWVIIDTSISPINVTGSFFNPNTNGAEVAYSSLDILSNGFKIRNTDSGFNSNGGTYIYAAFAENPFNYSRAR